MVLPQTSFRMRNFRKDLWIETAWFIKKKKTHQHKKLNLLALLDQMDVISIKSQIHKINNTMIFKSWIFLEYSSFPMNEK